MRKASPEHLHAARYVKELGMKPTNSVRDAQRATEAGVKEKEDFDETSDLCDFGYALAGGTGIGAAANTAADRRGDRPA